MRLKDVSSRQSVKAIGVSQASILSIPISCDHRMKLCQEMGSGNNSKKKKKKNLLRAKILINEWFQFIYFYKWQNDWVNLRFLIFL